MPFGTGTFYYPSDSKRCLPLFYALFYAPGEVGALAVMPRLPEVLILVAPYGVPGR